MGPHVVLHYFFKHITRLLLLAHTHTKHCLASHNVKPSALGGTYYHVGPESVCAFKTAAERIENHMIKFSLAFWSSAYMPWPLDSLLIARSLGPDQPIIYTAIWQIKPNLQHCSPVIFISALRSRSTKCLIIAPRPGMVLPQFINHIISFFEYIFWQLNNVL